MKQHFKKGRLGSSLGDGKAHEQDHKRWSRRDFLMNMGLAGTGGILFQKFALKALATNPLSYALNELETDRVLVLIRLKGGNDGLNMVVPIYDYGTYQSLRPNIALAINDLINLGDGYGMPNTMNNIQPLWNEGKMKIIQSVGYTSQNLSHFRSNDIWSSASDANQIDNTGWLGRLLENEFPDYLMNPPSMPPAIQIGGQGNIVFNSLTASIAMTLTNPTELFEIAQNGQLHDTENLPDCAYGEALGYVRAVTNSTYIYAGVLKEAYDASTTNANYTTSLGEQLALVARLIKGNLGTKLYMVELDGFDTHAAQNDSHPALMQNLSKAISDFYEDLGTTWSDKVLSMTFSEFGRRVQQNASGGTDHGAAAPLLMFGGEMEGNPFMGMAPDLQNLDEVGNLAFTTDFRQIYATVLQNWLCVPPDTVNSLLGQDFERLDNLLIPCQNIVGVQDTAFISFNHRIIKNVEETFIEFSLEKQSYILLQLIGITGQVLATLSQDYQSSGTHRIALDRRSFSLPIGPYIYWLVVYGQAVSGKVLLGR